MPAGYFSLLLGYTTGWFRPTSDSFAHPTSDVLALCVGRPSIVDPQTLRLPDNVLRRLQAVLPVTASKQRSTFDWSTGSLRAQGLDTFCTLKSMIWAGYSSV
ncbi:hypothetical protein DFH28DRAFT_931810 [Melampsora americana]|nr:hypothetical protein DFH28DRAFT_931810 [Melampsora americana]